MSCHVTAHFGMRCGCKLQSVQLCIASCSDFPLTFYRSQTKEAAVPCVVSCAVMMPVPATQQGNSLLLSNIPKNRQSLVRPSTANCIEGRINLERQSAAFCGQGAEAHRHASLPIRQVSVQHILVQCCWVQLQARETTGKKVMLTMKMDLWNMGLEHGLRVQTPQPEVIGPLRGSTKEVGETWKRRRLKPTSRTRDKLYDGVYGKQLHAGQVGATCW